MTNILRIDASARYEASVSRELTDELIAQLKRRDPTVQVTVRDLAQGVPFVTEAMVIAYNTPDEERTPEQQAVLQVSDELVAELQASDMIVLGTPIYNFSVPAALKAYIDLVCRARLTFRYTSDGPVGLLRDRKTYIIVTSGGTPVGSEIDFLSGYLRQVFAFIGIKDVEIIAADSLMRGGEEKIAQIKEKITTLV
jgi:FMN-dependent NADH-azoreductase